MIKKVQTLVFLSLIGTGLTLHIMEKEGSKDDLNSLRRVLGILAKTKLYLTSGDRRSINPVDLAKARTIFETISKTMAMKVLNGEETRADNILRAHTAGDPVPIIDVPKSIDFSHERIVAHELEDIEAKHSSALLHPAWVQKRGRNDFLVMAEDFHDTHVTVIPNDIYYNIEKKCTNWLDDCSLQGIRATLLNKIKGPFKR